VCVCERERERERERRRDQTGLDTDNNGGPAVYLLPLNSRIARRVENGFTVSSKP
jgi:hypothetical protein